MRSLAMLLTLAFVAASSIGCCSTRCGSVCDSSACGASACSSDACSDSCGSMRGGFRLFRGGCCDTGCQTGCDSSCNAGCKSAKTASSDCGCSDCGSAVGSRRLARGTRVGMRGCGKFGCGRGGRLCGGCRIGLGAGLQNPYGGTPHTQAFGGPHGPASPTVGYPYYTTRGPRDFLMANPPSIGR